MKTRQSKYSLALALAHSKSKVSIKP